jgi:hypothetical protein
MFKHNAINTIRMHPEAIRALGQLLDYRDAMDSQEQSGFARRREQWITMEPPRESVLELVGEVGSSKSYLVYTRNISARGVAIYHGVFVAPGKRCLLTLPLLDGEVVQLPGVIRRCRLVGGRVHELGVQFDRRIDVDSFVAAKDDPTAKKPELSPRHAAVIECAKRIAEACSEGSEMKKIEALIDEAREAATKQEDEAGDGEAKAA